MQVVEDYEDILPGAEILFRHGPARTEYRGRVFCRTGKGLIRVHFLNLRSKACASTVKPDAYLCSLVPAGGNLMDPSVRLAIEVLRGDKTAVPALVDRLIERGDLPDGVGSVQENIRMTLRELVLLLSDENWGNGVTSDKRRLERLLNAAGNLLAMSRE